MTERKPKQINEKYEKKNNTKRHLIDITFREQGKGV